MAIVQPINLSNWVDFTTTIKAPEVRAEFQNIYNTLNGGIDSSNLTNAAVTTQKITDGAVTDAKIQAVSSSKITGVFLDAQIPASLVRSTGGNLTGSLVFDVTVGTPLLKKYSTSDTVLFEQGTGVDKVQIIVGSDTVLKIVKNGVTLLSLTSDGTLTPKQLAIPVTT